MEAETGIQGYTSSRDELSLVGFYDYTLADNNVFWDDNMYSICGLDRGSDTNKNEYFFSLVHPEDQPKTRENFRENLRKGSKSHFQDHFRMLVNGKLLHVRTSGIIFRDSVGHVTRVVGSVSDKTSEFATQQALSRSEEKLRSILENTADNILSIDREGNIFYVNKVPPGLTANQVIGTKVMEYISEEDRENARSQINNVLNSVSDVGEFHTTFRGPKGLELKYYVKVAPIYHNERITGATFIARDQTEQEITQQKLRESEYLFRTLFESSTDKVFTIDKDWNVNLINQAPPGMSVDEILGRNLLEFLSEEDKDNVRSKLGQLFKENIPVEYISVFTYKNKDPIHYSTRASPLVENGIVYGAVLASRDITKAVEQAEQLRQKSLELQRTNQNLEQFAYISSHDMKAPVANLKSLIDLLESEDAISQDGKVIFDKIKQSVEQMSDTIKTLNEVFAVQSNLNLQPEQTKVVEVFRQVAGSIESLLSDSKTTIHTDFKLDILEFPRVHLSSILQNLITNAVKYRHPDRHPEITIKTYQESGFKWLEVSDNGKGIDLEKHGKKVFGLFQRFDLSAEGRGIGLHIIKNIVENYGGEVMLKSEPGMGTTFIIRMN